MTKIRLPTIPQVLDAEQADVIVRSPGIREGVAQEFQDIPTPEQTAEYRFNTGARVFVRSRNADFILQADGTWVQRQIPTNQIPVDAFNGTLLLSIRDIPSAEGAIPWQQKDYTEGTWHSNSVNNTRITVPQAISGIKLRAVFQLGGCTPDTAYTLEIRKNGQATTYPGRGIDTKTADSARLTLDAETATLRVEPGDYFEAFLVAPGATKPTLLQDDSYFAVESITRLGTEMLVESTEPVPGFARFTNFEFDGATTDKNEGLPHNIPTTQTVRFTIENASNLTGNLTLRHNNTVISSSISPTAGTFTLPRAINITTSGNQTFTLTGFDPIAQRNIVASITIFTYNRPTINTFTINDTANAIAPLDISSMVLSYTLTNTGSINDNLTLRQGNTTYSDAVPTHTNSFALTSPVNQLLGGDHVFTLEGTELDGTTFSRDYTVSVTWPTPSIDEFSIRNVDTLVSSPFTFSGNYTFDFTLSGTVSFRNQTLELLRDGVSIRTNISVNAGSVTVPLTGSLDENEFTTFTLSGIHIQTGAAISNSYTVTATIPEPSITSLTWTGAPTDAIQPYTLTGNQTFTYAVNNVQSIQGELSLLINGRLISTNIAPNDNTVTINIPTLIFNAGNISITLRGTSTIGTTFERTIQVNVASPIQEGFTYTASSIDGIQNITRLDSRSTLPLPTSGNFILARPARIQLNLEHLSNPTQSPPRGVVRLEIGGTRVLVGRSSFGSSLIRSATHTTTSPNISVQTIASAIGGGNVRASITVTYM